MVLTFFACASNSWDHKRVPGGIEQYHNPPGCVPKKNLAAHLKSGRHRFPGITSPSWCKNDMIPAYLSDQSAEKTKAPFSIRFRHFKLSNAINGKILRLVKTGKGFFIAMNICFSFNRIRRTFNQERLHNCQECGRRVWHDVGKTSRTIYTQFWNCYCLLRSDWTSKMKSTSWMTDVCPYSVYRMASRLFLPIIQKRLKLSGCQMEIMRVL